MIAIFLPPINKLKTYKISGEEHKRKSLGPGVRLKFLGITPKSQFIKEKK